MDQAGRGRHSCNSHRFSAHIFFACPMCRRSQRSSGTGSIVIALELSHPRCVTKVPTATRVSVPPKTISTTPMNKKGRATHMVIEGLRFGVTILRERVYGLDITIFRAEGLQSWGSGVGV